MRRVITIILVIVPFAVSADVGPLLKCLAQEEAYLHKNYITGPIYKLNQRFIADLAGSSDFQINQIFYKRACADVKTKSPSVALLREMITNRKNVFKYSNTQNAIFTKNLIDGLYAQLPELFINFLAGIQNMLEKPKCLQEQIPEITYFLQRFKHLQTELSTELLFDDHKKIDKIFKGLEEISTLMNKCKRPKEKSGKS